MNAQSRRNFIKSLGLFSGAGLLSFLGLSRLKANDKSKNQQIMDNFYEEKGRFLKNTGYAPDYAYCGKKQINAIRDPSVTFQTENSKITGKRKVYGISITKMGGDDLLFFGSTHLDFKAQGV